MPVVGAAAVAAGLVEVTPFLALVVTTERKIKTFLEFVTPGLSL